MSVAGELKQLKELLDSGVLSLSEFEAQKARLLAGGGGEVEPPIGIENIGAYRVLARIGEGGMGVVYRGRHRQATLAERQGGDVAIKVLHAQFASNSEYRARFEHEAGIGLLLKHPNVVAVHDLVEDGGNLAIVMEWVEGSPLSDMIGQITGPLPWERAWPLFTQVLDGVGHAHANGVIHRDLKPENVIVTSSGTVKVLDFGIAKQAGSKRTKTGMGMGTVDYMAPEQYMDAKRVDQRSDIYALGMSLYEILAGRLPWDQANLSEYGVLSKKSEGDFPPPTAFYPAIPPWVVDAVMSCVATDMDERPGSVEELRAALTRDAAKVEQTASKSSPDAEQPRSAAAPESPTSREQDRQVAAAKHRSQNATVAIRDEMLDAMDRVKAASSVSKKSVGRAAPSTRASDTGRKARGKQTADEGEELSIADGFRLMSETAGKLEQAVLEDSEKRPVRRRAGGGSVGKQNNTGLLFVELFFGVFQTFGVGHLLKGDIATGLLLIAASWVSLCVNLLLMIVAVGFFTWPLTWIGLAIFSLRKLDRSG